MSGKLLIIDYTEIEYTWFSEEADFLCASIFALMSKSCTKSWATWRSFGSRSSLCRWCFWCFSIEFWIWSCTSGLLLRTPASEVQIPFSTLSTLMVISAKGGWRFMQWLLTSGTRKVRSVRTAAVILFFCIRDTRATPADNKHTPQTRELEQTFLWNCLFDVD